MDSYIASIKTQNTGRSGLHLQLYLTSDLDLFEIYILYKNCDLVACNTFPSTSHKELCSAAVSAEDAGC